MPNKDKSMIHFSGNTDSCTKDAILNIFGFQDCDHKSKHLGLSFCKAKSKKVACSDTFDKLNSSLNGWKAKLLSQASKTVLINSIALALPSYSMSTIIFPKDFCYKMDGMIRKFWWGSNSNGNSLMLKCWDAICAPKSSGGLGFRRMADLNKALLSKLAWDISTQKDTTWIKLLTTKYLRGKLFLKDDISHHNVSRIWTDIYSCRDIIKKGAIFNVKTNSDLLIWSDPWIPTIPGFTPQTSSISNTLPVNLLKDLIDQRSATWN
ncbi:hypothetical protein CASFOL_020157 [Castilleja foliolosa]|uniref:Uncharacterized protein n=1 Tax=Castilleja foliolosa TaxID=1961234 RepID=A0ABD3D020_9LAMI